MYLLLVENNPMEIITLAVTQKVVKMTAKTGRKIMF